MNPPEVLLAGVMGYPISHSLSPEIFQGLGEQLGVPVVYHKLKVSPRDLSAHLKTLRKLSLLSGWNVTLPYKTVTAKQVDHLSPEAAMIGSVNVVQQQEGELRGYNTDVIGIVETLRELQVDIRGEAGLILGAGGGAASVAYVLGKQGAKRVWIVNRSLEKAKKMARFFEGRFKKTKFQAIPFSSLSSFSDEVALYVNATPLGMVGFGGRPPIPARLSRGAKGFDLIYRPLATPFLHSMEQQGVKTAVGLDMLVWQAIAAWEIWRGEISQARKEKLKRVVKKRLQKILLKESEGESP